MNKPLKQNLEFWKKEVDAALNKYWRETEQLPVHRNVSIRSSWKETYKVIKNGGKRLRPVMLLLMYEAVREKDPREIMPVAVTLELLHNFFLIHDDIIDGDHLRHGTATLNAIYGNSVALLLGDRLIIEALQIIVSSDLPPEQKKLAHTEFFKMINTTICGEMLDVMAKFPAEEKLIKEIIKNKTAYYTFVTPLKLGAQLAGARDEEVKLIEEFAYQLGDIFQWQDDYLGIFSDEKTLGKPAGSDLREKKPTLLLMKTYQGLAVQDKARLLNLMGRNLSLAELNKARELIKKSGANQWLENKISSTSKSLAESIKKSVLSKNTQNILAGLTKLLLGRKF